MIHTYPGEDLHVLNLDWLIKQYKNLVADLAELTSKFTTIETDFEQVRNDFANISAQFDALLQTINEEIENITNQKITEALSVYQSELETIRSSIVSINNRVGELESLTLNLYNQNKTYTDENIESLRRILQAQIAGIQYDIDRLQWELPDVYNLTRGVWTDLVSCLYDVYDACRDYAYTSRQFDSYGFTCDNLDARELTAYQWDINGREILHPDGYCRNPVSGEIEPVCEILEELAQMITQNTSLTAAQYDSLQMTALHYDALQLTAYTYDLFGRLFVR